MIRAPRCPGRMHVDERQPARSAGHRLHERLGLFQRHGVRGIAFIGLEVQGKEGPSCRVGKSPGRTLPAARRMGGPCRNDRCPKAVLLPQPAAVARHTWVGIESPPLALSMTARMLLAPTSRKSETAVCALRSITASSPWVVRLDGAGAIGYSGGGFRGGGVCGY